MTEFQFPFILFLLPLYNFFFFFGSNVLNTYVSFVCKSDSNFKLMLSVLKGSLGITAMAKQY